VPTKDRWCAVFDFDGTLVDPRFISLYRILKQGIGFAPGDIARFDALIERYLELALRGKLTQEDEIAWIFNETAMFLEQAKLTPLLAARLLVAAEFRRGALECLHWLKERDVPVAIVSFGVRPFVNMVLAAHDALDLVDEVYALRLKIDLATGLYCGWDESTLVLPSTKGVWSARFAAKHGISPGRIIGVGDSLSDRNIGGRKKNRFGFAPDEKRRRGMLERFGKVAVTEDFSPVSDWIKERVGSD